MGNHLDILRALLIQKDAKQRVLLPTLHLWFESFVNSERCKTHRHSTYAGMRLRALLIQKDVKHW